MKFITLFIILVLVIIIANVLKCTKLDNFDTISKKIFITFGAGGDNYIQAGKRLIKEANELNIFDKTILYTDEYLKNDKEFWEKHSTFIENNKRGYGYWLWKSFIIKKTMEQMNDGDVLLYADCGCEINVKKKDNILNDIEIVKNDNIVATSTERIERLWNKMDLILKLNMNEDKYINTLQNQASTILFMVCDKTRNLVNEWYELCCDYHLIDDTPSISPNATDFLEHRHDQSVFSLLTKKHNIYSDNILNIEVSRNK